jgi:hypothetical protein
VLARLLQREGYATGHFGKWHMGGQRDVGEAPLITEYGFDESLTNFEGLGPRLLGLADAHDGQPVRRHALNSEKLGRGPVIWYDRSRLTAGFTGAAIQFTRGGPAAIGRPDAAHTFRIPALVVTRRGTLTGLDFLYQWIWGFRNRVPRHTRWRTRPGLILFANPASQTSREALTLRGSHDDGGAWPLSHLAQAGPSAYSDLAVLPDGRVAVLYEKDGYQAIELVILSLRMADLPSETGP